MFSDIHHEKYLNEHHLNTDNSYLQQYIYNQ